MPCFATVINAAPADHGGARLAFPAKPAVADGVACALLRNSMPFHS